MDNDNGDHITLRRRSGFAKVPNSVVADERLSIEARGFLAYIISLPDGWVFRPSHLMKVCRIGRDKYYRIVKELRTHGYVKIRRSKDSRGRFVGTHWEIVCDPDATEIPEAADPESDIPNQLEKKDPLEKNISMCASKNLEADDPVCKDAEVSTQSKDGCMEMYFQEFWMSYPRPKDRSQTKKLFERALKSNKVDPQQLVAAAKSQASKYERERTPRHFMNTSVSWLDQRMWEEFASSPRASKTDVARYFGDRINAGRYIHPGTISEAVAREMMRLGVTNIEKLRALGITLEG